MVASRLASLIERLQQGTLAWRGVLRRDSHLIPLVFRPDVAAVKHAVVATLTPSDLAIRAWNDGYGES
jgi:hypothetical protein